MTRKTFDDVVRANLYGEAPAVLPDTLSFKEELDFDSLDMVEFVMDLEQLYNIDIPDEDASSWYTLGDARAWLRKRKVEV